ncbi:AAA family ATPase [Muribaculaceae bacterium Isolate-007 (NCI)]|nr:RNA-binding domain-containing protein [uncultured Duncaniella sp.]ROS81373.1 AAA family ATPase [Muribaculaceae bacterium Isolate-036 (Harlan)]ROT04245.1 AAA family ATPase [Muribaculaceae bacterium Isolate-100 (HZI)]RXE64269.1 AAA family ATPase [Muribaculaceae bacterium Isolate-007 (NCI)]RXE65186.1 AAA family ATPase [Muribaculaceae bacterium Isolate-001 (NCI)]
MAKEQYTNIFHNLISHSENEVGEFKKAENNFDFDDLGKYFSALSNEANLRGLDFAWLIFGYDEKKHEIVGTSYKNGEGALNNLKHDFSQHTTDGQTFREIIPIEVDGKRILMFKIPASPRNIVMKWKGIAYGRDGESLKPLNQSKQDEIRRQTPAPDWSAEIVPDATIEDLDEVAIAKARKMFKKVHSRIPIEEVNRWSTEEFLSKCELMVNGKLTRAAIILLGKMFSDSKLRPAVAEVTWTLRDEKQDVVDYEHFSVPFILTVDEILAKIHNLTLREMPGGTLFPDTMKQYDDYTIREALHNCIAHQDYTLRQRINFVENPGFLYYANGGSFIPGTLENALATNGPQRFFRNACLCKAMVHFNMIDTVSRGIKKMFTEQMERRFPMPDYEIDNEKKEVAVRIYGNAINERYTKLLKDNDNLTLHDCISLDAIQKGHRIDDEIAQDLLKRGLIEGETPNYTISLGVAKASRQLPQYTKAKGLDKARLKQMVQQLLQNAGKDGARREIIYDYLKDLLPSNKSQEQQLRYLGRLLVEMNEEGTIERIGLRWLLSSPSDRKQT